MLTAGHCICPFYDAEMDGHRSSTNCQANEGNSFANQQTSDTSDALNFLQIKVGNRDIENYHTLPSGKPNTIPLATPVEVETAIIGFHETDPKGRVILGNAYDIGIIIPISDDLEVYDLLSLNHLKLPLRYSN